MALDLQQRSAQHDHRWDNTRYETENGRVVLQAEPIKNGGITMQLYYAELREELEDCPQQLLFLQVAHSLLTLLSNTFQGEVLNS